MSSRYMITDRMGMPLKNLDATNRTQAYEQAEKCREFYPNIAFRLVEIRTTYLRRYQPK